MALCKICNKGNLREIYKGKIRKGQCGCFTDKPYTIFQCDCCNTIWHSSETNVTELYESDSYRNRVDGNAEPETYYAMHDRDTLMKLEWCKAAFFRNKTVADVGCAAGSFLDSVSGAAQKVIAIEPTEHYHKELKRKGFDTFSFTEDANSVYRGSVDVVTSFDVIEHVEDPIDFIMQIKEMVCEGGLVVVGTPTDYPHLRQLIGSKFDEFVFTEEHLWIFSEKGLRHIFEKCGFNDITIEYKQKFGLGNTIAWCLEKRPCGHASYSFITPGMDALYKEEMIRTKQADYLVVYARK